MPEDKDVGLAPYGGAERCGVEGCGRPLYCRGLCSRHYQTDLKNGSRLALPKQRPQAKLTEEDVRKIRRARGQGVQCKVLAERFGVSTNAIYYITSRTTWADVKMRRVARNGARQGEVEDQAL